MILVCSQKRWTNKGLKKGGVMVPRFAKGKERWGKTRWSRLFDFVWPTEDGSLVVVPVAVTVGRAKAMGNEHGVCRRVATQSGGQLKEGSRELQLRDHVTQGAGGNNESRNVCLSGLLWRLDGQYLHSTGNGKCELFLLCYAPLAFCVLGGG